MRLSKLILEWDGQSDQFEGDIDDISYERIETGRKYRKLFEKIKVLYEYKWKTDHRFDATLTEKIENWLGNFKSNDQRIAFELLNKIIRYDVPEMEMLCTIAFKKLMESFDLSLTDHRYTSFVNRHVVIMSFTDGGLDWFRTLRHFNTLGDKAFKFSLKEFDESTDSEFSNLKSIVFVEDFLSSGNTVVSKYNELKPKLDQIKKRCPNLMLYCFGLIATQWGIDMIRRDTEFEVVAGEILDINCKAFSDNSIIYPVAEEREVAKQTFERYGNSLGCNPPLGYNNDQLTVVLWDNTPDNTLPVIWYESDDWFPFFKRYKRYYGN